MTTDMQPGQDLTGPGQTAVSVLAGNAVDWVSTAPGKDFKPLHFEPNGWSELMRLEPGTVVPRHRHSGDAHVYTISGQRRLLDTGAIIKAGDFVFEPAGAVDSWQAIGDEPCVVHLKLSGRVEYLDDEGRVTGTADSASQLQAYMEWCTAAGRRPEPGLMGQSRAGTCAQAGSE